MSEGSARVPADIEGHLARLAELFNDYLNNPSAISEMAEYQRQMLGHMNRYFDALKPALEWPPDYAQLLELRLVFMVDSHDAALKLAGAFAESKYGAEYAQVAAQIERSRLGGSRSRRLKPVAEAIGLALDDLGDEASARAIWEWLEVRARSDAALEVDGGTREIYLDGEWLVVTDEAGGLGAIKFETFRTEYVGPVKKSRKPVD